MRATPIVPLPLHNLLTLLIPRFVSEQAWAPRFMVVLLLPFYLANAVASLVPEVVRDGDKAGDVFLSRALVDEKKREVMEGVSRENVHSGDIP